MDPLAVLQELVSIPGPPGQEELVARAVERHVKALGLKSSQDAKGNVLVKMGKSRIVVTAHLDEIAMIVRRIESDGSLAVGPLGGIFPWKLGEGPVQILATESVSGILSFGGIHTADKNSTVRQADEKALTWDHAHVFTGLTPKELKQQGVRPGTRVVVSPSRRELTQVGQYVAGYFLDDRADLVSWLLALDQLKTESHDVLFLATTSEEVGGEGALYALSELRPDICIALELGPQVDDSPIELSDQPTIWATDGYSTMSAADGDLVAQIGKDLKMDLQFQALTRGGSDASCAASHGHCARPITIGIPMANSHGYEIIHPKSMENVAKLTAALVRAL